MPSKCPSLTSMLALYAMVCLFSLGNMMIYIYIYIYLFEPMLLCFSGKVIYNLLIMLMIVLTYYVSQLKSFNEIYSKWD